MRGVEFHESLPLSLYMYPGQGQAEAADQALADVAEWLDFDTSWGFDPYVYLATLEREEELIFERATY